jgi:hypothetical protein
MVNQHNLTSKREHMSIITADQVEVAARSVVRRQGDHRNPSTEYTNRNGQHCFAGAILSALGVPVPGPTDGCNAAPVDSTPTQSFYASAGVDFHYDALRRLRELQDAADYGVKYNEQRTWAHAYAAPKDFRF